MSKLVDLLNKNKLTLIVSLPRNEPELAEAAVRGGADAIQLSLHSRVAGDLAEEKGSLAHILELISLPVGVALGGKKRVQPEELRALAKMGFDFLNLKIDRLPANYHEFAGVAKVLGMGSRFSIDAMLSVNKYMADALDAAIIPVSEHGRELVVGDLQNYISIVISAGIPVIIPAQRAIRPSEAAIIADTGAKGLMLTPVVTGTTAKHVESNTREFRVAVDDLGG